VASLEAASGKLKYSRRRSRQFNRLRFQQSKRGSGSSLDGEDHSSAADWASRVSRQAVRSYERIVEDEVVRETASWPERRELETLQSTRRLTLNPIVQARIRLARSFTSCRR
jgi:hypothetical protein